KLSPGEWQDDCDVVDLAALADVSDLADETLQAGQAYSARARRESEANAFAAALLLPALPLLARYVGSSDGANRLTTPALAEAFGVSEDVVLRRLTALLLEGDQVEEPVERVSAAMHEPQTRVLDPGQRVAVESGVPALIVAGPGTGKTSALLA